MGKRKATRKPKAKIKLKLDKQFTCFFCNQDKTIEIKLDRENSKGHLSCRHCGTAWMTAIHNLTDSVDVYGDWIDACEDAAEKAVEGQSSNPTIPERPSNISNTQRKIQRKEKKLKSDNEEEDLDYDSNIEKGSKQVQKLKKKSENLPDFVVDSDEDLSEEFSDEESEAQLTDEEDAGSRKRRLVSARDLEDDE